MKNNKGLTLVETLMALAVASILLTLSIPAISKYKSRSQLAYNARMLKTDINGAKMYAVKANSFVVCQIYDSYYELFVDDGSGGATQGDWKSEGGEKLIVKRTFPPSLSLQSNFPGNHFRFRGYGRIRPGTVTIKSVSGSRIDLVMNALGRVRLVTR
jgi:prepilin-type N-terminal cleavage/methylation domain-containing protein